MTQARESVHIVHVVPGDPRRAWCDRCATSARLVIEMYVLFADGPRCIGGFDGCTRCDPELFA